MRSVGREEKRRGALLFNMGGIKRQRQSRVKNGSGKSELAHSLGESKAIGNALEMDVKDDFEKNVEDSNKSDVDSDTDANSDVDSDADADSDVDADANSGSDVDSDSGSDSDSSDSTLPKLKKKKNTDDGLESFANAVLAIVGSRLKAYDRKDPIFARNKVSIQKLESDKLEAKAKRALACEKKQDSDKFRITNLLPMAGDEDQVRKVLEKERGMKKVAQKGVVRLFNAVLSTQVRTFEAISKEKVGYNKKEELMNEISKEKFLDLVQAAGEE